MSAEERHQKIAAYGSAYDQLAAALKQFPHQMWTYKPGPDRWSIHEIILHLTDSEANSYIRCRRFIAESGKTVMAYDENKWAIALRYHDQNPEDALELFRLLRRMSWNLLRFLPDSVWANTIDHPENGVMRMEDWLTVYTNHVPDHIQQMQATYHAWLDEQKGQKPDPKKSLFRFFKTC